MRFVLENIGAKLMELYNYDITYKDKELCFRNYRKRNMSPILKKVCSKASKAIFHTRYTTP